MLQNFKCVLTVKNNTTLIEIKKLTLYKITESNDKSKRKQFGNRFLNIMLSKRKIYNFIKTADCNVELV